MIRQIPLKQNEVIEYLNGLHEKYVFAPINKAANSIAIIYKNYNTSVIWKEISILDSGNYTYEKIKISKRLFKII